MGASVPGGIVLGFATQIKAGHVLSFTGGVADNVFALCFEGLAAESIATDRECNCKFSFLWGICLV